MKYFLVRNINMLYLDGNRTRQRDAKENMKFSITTQRSIRNQFMQCAL